MAGDIALEQAHSLGRAVARKRLDEVEAKLKERFGVSLQWTGDTAQVSGKGVSGSISITDTLLVVNLKLGLMMRPLAGQIRAAMQRQIDKALV
jgi:putative polyhydroxyalkanoate system protein